LLVEDNELNQEVAVELLQDAGFVVDVAGDGRQALDKLQQQPAGHYDAVLMDMQMPVLDGLGATAEIRRLPQFGQLPIIAMTANAMQGDRERCLQAGMNDYVAKPIAPDELWRTLQRWIPARASRNPAVPPGPPQEAAPAALTSEDGLPQGIASLDTALGLSRVAGKRGLYRNLLQKFVTLEQDALTRISTALDAGDAVTSERIAHTLKSTAGSIGASPLQAAAAELELALHRQEPRVVIEPLLEGCARLLGPLVSALAEWLQGAQSEAAPLAPNGAGTDPALAEQTLQQLIELLTQSDSAAEQLWQQGGAQLKPLLGQRWDELDAALRGFDFDGALQLLRELSPGKGGET
jgi:two-component system, sensor histidine kinase and response regulator